MREKTPGWFWIPAACLLIPAALMAGFFLPLKDCPECEDARLDFAELGIDVNSIKSAMRCGLCDERKKVSLLTHRASRSAHP